jgi:hypothetical protein
VTDGTTVIFLYVVTEGKQPKSTAIKFAPEKNLPRFFRLREIHKKPKKTHILAHFWLPHQQMGSMAGTFPMPDFNSSYTITHRNFVRIGDKNFLEKTMNPYLLSNLHPEKTFKRA